VGEIFTKAGETFHKLADMTVMLQLNDSNTKELLVGGAKVVELPKQQQQTNGVVTKVVMARGGVVVHQTQQHQNQL